MHHENVNKLATVPEKNLIHVQYKIKFDRPPHLKKLPEALIISPELRHLYRQADTKSRSRQYITRTKRLDTSKRDTS